MLFSYAHLAFIFTNSVEERRVEYSNFIWSPLISYKPNPYTTFFLEKKKKLLC